MSPATIGDGCCSFARLVTRRRVLSDAVLSLDPTFPPIPRSAIEDVLARGLRITVH